MNLRDNIMQKFKEVLHKELTSLWNKCFFGEEQRSAFQPFYTEVYTEEALAEHEHHFTSLKQYYNENKDLFKFVLKRETLWEKN